MKTALLTTALLATSLSAFADTPVKPLNTISYHVTQQTWVQATTAKLTVTVNASLNAKQLANFQQTVMTKLKTLGGDKWRVSNFNQSRGSSGLENVSMSAYARLPSSSLSGVTDKTKALSSTGITYRVSNIDFSPSFKQIEKAKQQLRYSIYKDVLKQLKETNTIFKNTPYTVHTISFNDQLLGDPVRRPVPMMSYAAVPSNSLARKTASNNVSVSQHLQVSANVTLGY